MNPHVIGTIMRDTVRRAIIEIRKQRIVFTSTPKINDYKTDHDDLVTSADYAAQEIYVKLLLEAFPKAGIIAEEDFARKCTDRSSNYYFTIDPLDGTKAFGRRQSYGVSTMLSFVKDGVIEAATIGDVMTQEIFHTRPQSKNVHRIHDFETPEKLYEPEAGKTIFNEYILLRDDPREHSPFITEITSAKSPIHFKGLEISSGSIGCMFSRLWKKEVGAIVLKPGHQTPWDSLPILGLSRKLNYRFFTIGEKSLYEFQPDPFDRIKKSKRETIVVHETKVQELKTVFNKLINKK